MNGLFWFIALMTSLVLNGLTAVLSYRKVNKALDRAKAKDLGEFKHYEQEYPKDLKHKEETMKAQRKARKKRAKPSREDVMSNKFKDKY